MNINITTTKARKTTNNVAKTLQNIHGRKRADCRGLVMPTAGSIALFKSSVWFGRSTATEENNDCLEDGGQLRLIGQSRHIR